MPDSGTPEDPISALLRMVTGSGSPDVSAVVPWLRRMMNAASEGDPWGAASRQPPPPPPPPRPARPVPPRLTPPAAGEDGSRSLYWSLLDLVGDLQRSWNRAAEAPGQADVVDLALKGVITALTTPAVREQFAPRPLRVVRDEPIPGEFELFRTRSGGYGFRLRDEEGEVLATAKGFVTKQQALDGIAAVRAHASAPVVDTTVEEEAEPVRPVPEPGGSEPATPTAGKPGPASSPPPPRKTAKRTPGKATKQTATRTATKATKQTAKTSSRTATTKAAKTARKATKGAAPKPAPEPFEAD